jgi:hypothetical protein
MGFFPSFFYYGEIILLSSNHPPAHALLHFRAGGFFLQCHYLTFAGKSDIFFAQVLRYHRKTGRHKRAETKSRGQGNEKNPAVQFFSFICQKTVLRRKPFFHYYDRPPQRQQ